jgi:hypothetical protein
MSTTIYDDCGCGNNSNYHGIKPPNLKCPPDLSTMLFRFADRKSLGVIKGNNDLFKIDMSSFFLPLDNYSVFTITLCPGETKQINVSNIANTGKRKQITEFDTTLLQNISFSAGVTASLTISENNTILSTVSNIDASSFLNFFTDLSFKVISDTIAGGLISISNLNPIISISTQDKGKYLEYELEFTNLLLVNEELIGDITQTAERYPDLDHVKLVFGAVEYCSDCTSNTQYIEYAYSSDYITNGDNSNWRKSSKLIMLMGTDDILDSDENFIETLWLKNTIDCSVNIHTIIGI